MSALQVQQTLSHIEKNMTEFAPYRKPALFNEFLVKGYTAITLSSVPQKEFSELLQAKLCLGTLITLYDDFADRPATSNPQLLETLYGLRFGKSAAVTSLNTSERQVLDFAGSLFQQMEDILGRQPHYQRFSEIMNFDLMQFYSANQYSSLITASPYIGNALENRLYAHHNMGMIMVSMMDLMATPQIELSEFGAIREVFLMGQRAGRIFNVLTTRKREVLDGDMTGELATYKNDSEIQSAEIKLRHEIQDLYERIFSLDAQVTTFSVKAYCEGLMKVQKLHQKMEGTI